MGPRIAAGWVARVLVTAVRHAMRERIVEAAASVGFFAVFSLFPFLLILVAIGSTLLADTHTQEQILTGVLRFLPVSRDLVSQNMLMVLGARGAVGIIGAIGLLWSSTSAFTTLARNLTRAWPGAKVPNAVKARLAGLALLGSLVALAVLFLVAKAALPVAGTWDWFPGLSAVASGFLHLTWRVILLGLIFGGLVLLYRWVPRTRVRWIEAVAGAAGATVAFGLATSVFTWYLKSGLARYNIVYGSLGALLALLSWVYIVSVIVLFGAHLGAAVAHHDDDGTGLSPFRGRPVASGER